MSAASADTATGWLKFTAWGLALLAAGYVAFQIVENLVPAIKTMASKIGSTANQVVNTAGNVISETAVLTDVTAQEAASLLGFDFSTDDPTSFPGYAPGNWNKMMAMGGQNPLSLSYVGNPYSVSNPGPTQVHNWALGLYSEMHQSPAYLIPGISPNYNKILAILQQIPDQDNMNLVYRDLCDTENFDLTEDINGLLISFTDTFKDLMASIILNKPTSSISKS